MMTRQSGNQHDDLRDPGLAALLREAYADDPALQEAPGRTDRIMRAVMASGVRPKVTWMPFAWAGGLAATAAVAVMLALGMQHPTTPTQRIATVTPPTTVQTAPPVTPSPTTASTVQRTPPVAVATTAVPAVREKAHGAWITPAHAKRTPPSPTIVAHAPAAAATPVEDTSNGTAADLYAAGSTAHAAGDYETAYAAYQASYAMVPTPDALLASAEAMSQLADEEDTIEVEG